MKQEKYLDIKGFPQAIAELEELFIKFNSENLKATQIDEELKATQFYNLMQDVTELNASNMSTSGTYYCGVDVLPESSDILFLVLKIAVNIPSLTSLNISCNFLEQEGPAFAEEIAKITLLESLNLKDTYLNEYGPNTITKLTKLSSLKSLNLSNNDLGEYGLATIVNITKLLSLETINLSNNKIGEYNPEALVTPDKMAWLYAVNFNCKDLIEQESVLIATEIIKLPLLKLVSLYYNGINKDSVRKVFDDHNKEQDYLLFKHACLLSEPEYFDLPQDVINYIALLGHEHPIEFIL